MDGYLKGAVPSADRALALSDVLGVQYRWLISGQGPQETDQGEGAGDSVLLPRFDPFAFNEYGKGATVEDVAVPRWLVGAMKSTAGLWLTTMPSDALPDVAREGQTVVCRDPDVPLQDRKVYILLLDGRPIVRRVFVRPDGLLLKGEDEDDTILVRPDDMDRLVPAGRVLGALGLDGGQEIR